MAPAQTSLAPTKIARVLKIPCVLMRGGTSRGPFFLESDLPADRAARDRVLLAAMGSPHALQVDGIGGGAAQTSKVAIVARSTRPGADVDFLFAQVSTKAAIVDTSPNCGNMLAGVGPFAIEAGLAPARADLTPVRIYNRNTGVIVEATVQTPGGRVTYEGTTAIDGVGGTAAPITLSFANAAGSKTGALLPTGLPIESIDGVDVSLVDYATPMMLVNARDLGACGAETPDELDANAPLLRRIEALRREAGRRMGLGDVANRVIPKVALLSPARAGGALASRYFTPDRCHRSHAVTGALCVAVAARIPGTIAARLLAPDAGTSMAIEHPSGRMPVEIAFGRDGAVAGASVIRTARRIFEGVLSISASALAPSAQETIMMEREEA